MVKHSDKDHSQITITITEPVVSTKPDSHNENMHTYTFDWKDGTRETIDGESPEDALERAGHRADEIELVEEYFDHSNPSSLHLLHELEK